MGLYRLFLSVAVAVAHACGYSFGVVAVISFFILSGYVMSMLIEKYYNKPTDIPYFYLDRIVRLYPQFLFYMMIYAACIYFLKVEPLFVDVQYLSLPKWIVNLFIIPQGFYMFWLGSSVVIPQTWSLGLEMTFYIVIPWILIFCSSRQIYWVSFFSFLIFLSAYFGKINSDYFGYRLLPGTLFIFFVGWSFFKNNNGSKVFIMTVFLLTLILMLIAYFNVEIYQRPYIKEVLLGLLIGMLATKFMKYYTFTRTDEFLGNLSYGIFLNHIIIISLMTKFFSITKFNFFSTTILLLVSSALAFLSYYCIERPALRLRHNIRYNRSANR